ncbi:MAG TPA: SidA/IucD/PvdA family monooxygenase [Acidimicrobiales bacterium]|nr:SidA/IucD/PvdA family monooxygenase [Acidimicrobiales bacterium]
MGIGFGPANLALAIALEELFPEASVRFIEAQPGPTWQPGMLLRRSDIQHNPLRDLVTPRNPRSRYTFVNYLHETGRLFEFLNVPLAFPLRKEYARYITWAARQFADRVDYGVRATSVARGPEGRGYQVAAGGTTYTAGSLVVAPGRSQHIPPQFSDVLGDRVVHAADYLRRIDEWRAEGARHIVVVGSSQSACELMLDLLNRSEDLQVTNLMRGFGYRLKDTSPFMEEVYFPGFVDYYYQASQASKDDLDRQLRHTNYSSVDEDVLKELYVELYEQRLDGRPRAVVHANRDIQAVEADETGVRLLVQERHTGEAGVVHADAVVLATGFRDLGSGPRCEPCPPLLSGIAPDLRMDGSQVWVGPDYDLAGAREPLGPVYLNGLCESTHGMGDAGSFSLLALRSARIARSLRGRAEGTIQPAATTLTARDADADLERLPV